jgi:acetyl coenzyme A synthetase (ADP forming)-like protein
LDRLFEPSSVAIVGASREEGKLGHEVLSNLIAAGCRGRLYPVNPKVDRVAGLACYPSVDAIPEEVDMVVVIVPARFVPEVMEQCARKHVKAAVIISGGFREVGPEGEELEKTVGNISHKAGIRTIGPNCQGINNPHAGLCATWPLIKKKGPVAIVTQSGTIGAALSCWAENEEIGISKCVALGNRIDINECDLIDYFADDPNTKVIALYIEGVADGRRFVEACSRVSKKKPIVILRGGRTPSGRKAMLSHTKSLAGKDQVFDAVCRKTGLMRVSSLEELFDAVKAFSLLPLPKTSSALIVTSTGGSAILASDTFERLGVKLPEPDEMSKEKLRGRLPSQCILSNPLDLTMTTADNYEFVIKTTASSTDIGSFLAIFGDPIPGASDAISRSRSLTEKPIVVSYLGGADVEKQETLKMRGMGIPVYPSPERAAAALSGMMRYSSYTQQT